MVEVFHPTGILEGEVELPSSKSITNRLLVLKAIHKEIEILNISEAEDSELLQSAIQKSKGEIFLNHAGSALRFLTAFFAFSKGAEVTLTGSERLQQRPIKVLVDALRSLGANIQYLEKDGFAPLKIKGVNNPAKNEVEIDASISSQFITALMLIASKFENGLSIKLKNKAVSSAYINTTLSLMQSVGYKVVWEKDVIEIIWTGLKNHQFVVEPDWSAATFYFGMAVNSKQVNVFLKGLQPNSVLGDSNQLQIFKKLGLNYEFESSGLRVKNGITSKTPLKEDLNEMPDVTQGLAVAAAMIGKPMELVGLDTLPQKESNRIEDLAVELRKIGVMVKISKNSISISGAPSISDKVTIKTYNDHRMAMAFATLALKTNVIVDDEEVVKKSFPSFWNQLRVLGFTIIKCDPNHLYK